VIDIEPREEAIRIDLHFTGCQHAVLVLVGPAEPA
jgi:hypothetical protein